MEGSGMKKIILSILFVFSSGIIFFLYSANYQHAEIYICEDEQFTAELSAKASISRKELYIVGYCSCQGVDKSLKSLAKKGSCTTEKDNVYICRCIGKANY
jgi:hypothetical protein